MSDCRVYWGSHGCCLPRGHEGGHFCSCAFEDDDPSKPLVPREQTDEDGPFTNVGAPPHYGPETNYYGEDASAHRPHTQGADAPE